MFQEVLGKATMMAGTCHFGLSVSCTTMAAGKQGTLGRATVVTRHVALLESDGGALPTATGWPAIIARGMVLQVPAQWGYYSCWEGGKVLQKGLLLVGITMAEGKALWRAHLVGLLWMLVRGCCALCTTSAMLLWPSIGI